MDRGSSWIPLALPSTTVLTAVWGSSANDVYVVGTSGTILHSSDGTTFTAEPSGVTFNLNGVGGSGPNDVYAVGDHGTILHLR